MDDASDGIKINGKLLNNIRYSDDTVVIAGTSDGLRRLIDSTSSTRLKNKYCKNQNICDKQSSKYVL